MHNALGRNLGRGDPKLLSNAGITKRELGPPSRPRSNLTRGPPNDGNSAISLAKEKTDMARASSRPAVCLLRRLEWRAVRTTVVANLLSYHVPPSAIFAGETGTAL